MREFLFCLLRLCLTALSNGFRLHLFLRLLHISVGFQPGIVLALFFDPLVGNMIDHQGCRIHILLHILVLFSGAIGNGPNQAGNGDLHCTQKQQNRSNHADQDGCPSSKGPFHQQRQTSADNTAAESLIARLVEIRNGIKARCHSLVLNRQMVNTAAQQHEEHSANTAHLHICPAAKNMNDK